MSEMREPMPEEVERYSEIYPRINEYDQRKFRDFLFFITGVFFAAFVIVIFVLAVVFI